MNDARCKDMLEEERFVGELHPDEDFDNAKCNARSRLDAERVDAVLCHIMAGSAIEFTAREMRDWLRSGDFPNAEHEDAVEDALNELDCIQLRTVVYNSGASVREVARFIRRTGPRRWPIVWFLNGETPKGNDELPWYIDKNVASGYGWWVR